MRKTMRTGAWEDSMLKTSVTAVLSCKDAMRFGLLAGGAALVLTVGAVGVEARAQGQPSVVKTGSGEVHGATRDHVRQFLGIPYAAPPIGPLRWQTPQTPVSWTGVREAAKFGATCAQIKTLGDFADPSTSEDCLYINVFAPEKPGAKKKPVMVWIHGGGLTVGQSDGHDGGGLAAQEDVVVVTLNYRLGVLGFLAHPALDDGGKAVNFGLLDQQLALKWVKDNIAAFGGDPGNVTIFGESAGGLSVAAHLASPLSKDLFQRAIIESGYAYTATVPFAAAEQNGKDFATAMGCPDQTAACLRQVPVEKLLTGGRFFKGLTVDNYSLKSTLQQAFETGNFNRVPVLLGSNQDESRWFVALAEHTSGHVVTANDYPQRLATAYNASAKAVETQYPLSAFGSPSEALSAAQSDKFVCPNLPAADAISKFAPVFEYEFADRDAPTFEKASFPYKAYHTAEIQYLFPGFKGVFKGPTPALSKDQERLAVQIKSYWATFARNGDPNSARTPAWPRYRKDQIFSLRPSGPVVVKTFEADHKCGFWATNS
jgi:para-nitrobenzyl esterase